MPQPTKKQRVQDFVAARAWALIGKSEWDELKAALPDISESTIRGAGIPIAQPWLGVRQHTMDELESSLREMAEVYTSKPDLRRYCRDQVISAKIRARSISSNAQIDEDKRHLKAEMTEWMLVWLDDPSMFPAWASMRRRQMSAS